MKTPIEPSDIRAGDLIRVEHGTSNLRATELVAEVDGHDYSVLSTDRVFLLDRPTPPVELPTEPTLGWLTYRDTDYPSANSTTEFGEWKYRVDRVTVLDVHGSTSVPSAWVTAFTAATAVPTDALNELRKYRSDLDWDCATPAVRRIDAFLSAVDEANR